MNTAAIMFFISFSVSLLSLLLSIVLYLQKGKIEQKKNRLIDETEQLYDETVFLKQKLKKYQPIENAEKEAGIIIKNAQDECDKILSELTAKSDFLRKQIEDYEYRTFSFVELEKDIKQAIKKNIEKAGKDFSFMIFDSETTGLPGNGKRVYILQLSWILLDKNLTIIREENYYLKPPISIPSEAISIHGITDEIVNRKASPAKDVLLKFHQDAICSERLVAHNFEFDADRVDFETRRAKIEAKSISTYKSICTMLKGAKYCKIPGRYGDYKWPRLEELADHTGIRINSKLHDSLNDCMIVKDCLKVMLDEGFIKINR
jgi:DNA polymerase III epsilon subunit-like protein